VLERAKREGPHGASRVDLLLRSFGLRVSHVPRAHLKSVARGRRALGLSGSALEAERRGITRSSLRRTELESSLHPKEEETSSVKSASCVATTAGPTPAAGEDSARRIVLVCRTLKTRYRSRRAATGSGKHPHQSDSGCARGPSRGNRVCKRNAVSQRRNGAVGRHVGGKTNESRTGSRHWVDSRCCAANVARRRPKKCTFRWKSCRIAKRRGLHGPRCEAN